MTGTAVTANGFTVRIIDIGDFINAAGTPNDPPNSVNEDDRFTFIAIGPSPLLI